MGANFEWFKDVTIVDDYIYEFTNGDCTSHSYGKSCDICEIFKENTNIEIPSLSYSYRYENKSELNLVDPKNMISACDKLLRITGNDDIEEFRDRIEWFKELSEQGYYIAYVN